MFSLVSLFLPVKFTGCSSLNIEMWKEKDFSSPPLLHGTSATVYVKDPGARTVD